MHNESLPTVPNTTTAADADADAAIVPIATPTAHLVPPNAPALTQTVLTTPYHGYRPMGNGVRVTLAHVIEQAPTPSGPCFGVMPDGQCIYFDNHEALDAYRQRLNAENPPVETVGPRPYTPQFEDFYPTPPDTFTIYSPANPLPPVAATNTASSSTFRLGNATNPPITDDNVRPHTRHGNTIPS